MSVRPLIVVGSINADLVMHCERLPEVGETVHGDSFRVFHGGKGANQAVAIAKLGNPVHLIGLVGTDSFGAELLRALETAGVDVSAIGIIDGSSGVASIDTDDVGRNRIIVVSGANGKITPAHLDNATPLLENAGMILTQLEIPMATIVHLSILAERVGVPLIVDPAPASHLPPELMRRIAWLTPNLTEASFLIGRHLSPQTPNAMIECAEALLSLGPRNVLLKLGDLGLAAATSDGHRYYIPAYRVKAVDTTGAGDALNAGFATAVNHGATLHEALERASAVAAISVTRPGAQTSLPTAKELEAFLRNLEEVTQ